MDAPTRRRLSSDARREEILDAALRIFATRDVDTVSMQELARESRASAALIYHYFGDKHAVARAALAAAADDLIARMRTDPAQPAVAQLATGLEVYLDYLHEHPVSWSALLSAGSATAPEVAAIARRVDDHALSLSARALGCQPPDTVLALALRGWLELVKSVCLTWLSTGSPDRATVQTLLAGAFVGCVEAAAGADPGCAPALSAIRGDAGDAPPA